jgi:hypothetical protein
MNININIINGIAAGMEKEADEIASNKKQVLEVLQPQGKILSEAEQATVNSIIATLEATEKHLRKTAAQLRKWGDFFYGLRRGLLGGEPRAGGVAGGEKNGCPPISNEPKNKIIEIIRGPGRGHG